jgi:hypothetical protein
LKVSGSFDPGYLPKDWGHFENLRFGHETEIVHLILTLSNIDAHGTSHPHSWKMIKTPKQLKSKTAGQL